MRILHIAPPFFPLREDQGYGGIERVMLDLIKNQEGHDVHVAAPQGSRLEAEVHETVPPTGFFTKDRKDYAALYHTTASLAIANRIKPDIIHVHDDYYLPFMPVSPAPSILTLHAVYEDFWDLEQHPAPKGVNLVAISERQRSIYEQHVPVKQVIYNGIDTGSHAYNGAPLDYLLSLGAIRPEKGQEEAIRLMQESSLPNDLIIAGNIGNQDYFDRQVRPRLTHDLSDAEDKLQAYLDLGEGARRIVYVGEVNDGQKIPLYQHAMTFLMPVTIEEPFGLVVMEAMSCGTPVIATRKGAMPELLTADTGLFLGTAPFTALVGTAAGMSRKACRERVENRFSSDAMTKAYERLYRELAR